MTAPRIPWQGRVISVQPRIRLLRSFNERSHSYLGYVLQIDGVIGGKAVYAKHGFRNGVQVSCVLSPQASVICHPFLCST